MLGPDFVRRTEVGWHAFFVGIMALTAFLLVADHHAAWVSVLVMWSLAYVLLARTRIFAAEPGPRAWVYLMVAYACFVIVVSVDRYAEIGLFILYPHTFAFVRRQKTAAWVAVGFTAAYTLALCVQDGFGRTSLIRNGLNGAVSVGFALILGIFISGVVTQNLRHRQLLEELINARERLDLAEREAGALAERERFAREIHDTLAQGFLSAITLTQAAAADRLAGDLESLDRHLQRIEQTARDNLREARALVAGATRSPSRMIPSVRRSSDACTDSPRRRASTWSSPPMFPVPAVRARTWSSCAPLRKHWPISVVTRVRTTSSCGWRTMTACGSRSPTTAWDSMERTRHGASVSAACEHASTKREVLYRSFRHRDSAPVWL